jgi:hypothetical protein
MSFDWFVIPILAADQSPVVIDPGIIALFIPILAIVFGSIAGILKMLIHHRERMAKIGMGMDPDAPTASAAQPQNPSPRYGG